MVCAWSEWLQKGTVNGVVNLWKKYMKCIRLCKYHGQGFGAVTAWHSNASEPSY
jgi:hypothetical protein